MIDLSHRPAHLIAKGARALGLSDETYRAQYAAGLSRCSGCKAWHPISDFGRHRQHWTGLNPWCKVYVKSLDYHGQWWARERARLITQGKLKPRVLRLTIAA